MSNQGTAKLTIEGEPLALDAAGYIYFLERKNSSYIISKNLLTFQEDSSGK
ncbi:hypothetical protein NLC35_03170 [Candidatus Aminicenantes bacterium AC-334-K16]|jgi:hypothetical protein|nr:hypothetical protein [Candidatus Aminicenantes bacterium AC-334-K16]